MWHNLWTYEFLCACRAGAKPQNPLLPYDENLWVAHLSKTHTLLLNKFNLVAHHTLVVTREFEAQEAPLSPQDMASTLIAMRVRPSSRTLQQLLTASQSQCMHACMHACVICASACPQASVLHQVTLGYATFLMQIAAPASMRTLTCHVLITPVTTIERRTRFHGSR